MPINRFVRLAKVFIDGRGVPFLGAGVSQNATCPAGTSWRPTVSCMIGDLIDAAIPFFKKEKNQEQELAAALGIEQFRKDNRPDELQDFATHLKDKINGRLGDLCQALLLILDNTRFNRENIVEALNIREYVNLLPTPAHYYMAFLVREGLVNEVITTNYDCCLERAVYYSHGRDDLDGNLVAAISSLANYRARGARRLSAETGQAILRMYKINGCAGSLSDDPPKYDSILLTRQQLRDMDDRAWARDLLKDRARSRALVFSGFGSDEPQVQFTLERILEEFSMDGSGSSTGMNGIWVNVYEEKPTLTQLLLLKGMWGGDANDYLLCGRDSEGIRHSVNGETASSTGNDHQKLPADLFWQTLFEVVFLALLEQHTEKGNNGWQFLAGLDSRPEPVLRKSQLQDWIDPRKIGRYVLGRERFIPETKGALQRVDALLRYGTDNGGNKREGVLLCRWLRAFLSVPPADNELPEIFYQPLGTNTEVVLTLLWIHMLAGQTGSKAHLSVEQDGDNLILFLRYPPQHNDSDDNLLQYDILLTEIPARAQVDRAVNTGNRSPVLVAASLRQNIFFRDIINEEYFTSVENSGCSFNDEGTIHLRYIRPVSIKTLLRHWTGFCDSRPPENQSDIFCDILACCLKEQIKDTGLSSSHYATLEPVDLMSDKEHESKKT